MVKLKTIGPRLGTIAPLIARPERDTRQARIEQDSRAEYRRWYKLARWKAKPNGLRWQVLVRDGFTCQRCGYLTRDTNASDMVADHIAPHRGVEALFWDADNVQCLCKACHDGAKQREERRGWA
ncbi:HNH endonuclease [Thioclava kandeliae]|uniref:Putative HNH nuclease YajD n=1 Tax=Thioclava kandeliae TaxID=3070818 RepID=A0ABV1SFC1_9RHOB